MKGTLLNPFEAVPTVAPFGGVEIEMSAQEAAFWLWRVSEVLVSASASIAGSVDDGVGGVTSGSYSNSVNNIYFCPKPGVLPLYPATEFDQAYQRARFGNALGGGVTVSYSEPFEPPPGNVVEAFQFVLDWAANWQPSTGTPLRGTMTLFTGFPVLFIPNVNVPVGGQFSVFPPSLLAPFPGTIHLEGYDPVLNVTYEHDVVGYWDATVFDGGPGSAGLTSGSADIFVQAATYYEWRDGAGPTYEAATGAKVVPPEP